MKTVCLQSDYEKSRNADEKSIDCAKSVYWLMD